MNTCWMPGTSLSARSAATLGPVTHDEQIGQEPIGWTVGGPKQTRPAHPTVGEDAGLDESFDLGVEVAGIGAGLAGDVGDACLPFGLQEECGEQPRLRLAPQNWCEHRHHPPQRTSR
jgi:hypothetical protein